MNRHEDVAASTDSGGLRSRLRGQPAGSQASPPDASAATTAFRSPLGVPAYMRGFNETWTQFDGLRRCRLHFTTEPYRGSTWVCPECVSLDRRWERDTRDD